MTGERQSRVSRSVTEQTDHIDEPTWSKRRLSVELVFRHRPAKLLQLISDVLRSRKPPRGERQRILKIIGLLLSVVSVCLFVNSTVNC